jgi:glycosyltransferase involved in cell wall biosynthesis
VERIFLALAVEFARRGHDVTMISRRFEDFPDHDVIDGVRHLRIASRDAPANRLLYRIFDVLYALHACFALPASDVTITHSVFLPLIIPRKRAGKICVSVGRFPKNQMGLYRRVDRLHAVSSSVASAICQQTPSVAARVKVLPYALGAAFCAAIGNSQDLRQKELLYVGRIAREKGIDILIRAFLLLSDVHRNWRLVIVGPFEVAQGGDGTVFLEELKKLSEPAASRIDFVDPIFDEKQLIARFERAAIFVYPSVASRGESFGMAPLEAMACGCPVVTSSLECFNDFLRSGENGLQFDHTDPTGKSLAEVLDRLISSPHLRSQLAREASSTSRLFTPSKVAEKFLDDFAQLTSSEPANLGASQGLG